MTSAKVKLGILWCPDYTMFFYLDDKESKLYKASDFIRRGRDDIIRTAAFWLEAMSMPTDSVTELRPRSCSESFLGSIWQMSSVVLPTGALWRLYATAGLSFCNRVVFCLDGWIPLTLTRHDNHGFGSITLFFDEHAGSGSAGIVYRSRSYGLVVKVYKDDNQGWSEFQLLSLAASLQPSPVPKVRGLFSGSGFNVVFMDDGGHSIDSLDELDQSQL